MKNPMNVVCLAVVLFLNACNDSPETAAASNDPSLPGKEAAKTLKFKCAISNGMKGDSLFFEVSPDRKKLSNLYFKGYWRCSGFLTQEPAAGPKGSFEILNDKFDGVISEPPGGGSTSWRFELHGALTGKNASGTFRMNINNLGCDSYVLKFAGAAE